MNIFSKILIANRGEIAVRIIKSAKSLGIKTVAIYSEIDINSYHIRLADETYCIGKQELADTYLNIDKIIEIAKKSNCQAIHPGYGFLSENPKFAEACEKNNLAFIGPKSNVIKLMGNKIEARNFIQSIGVPLLKGSTGEPEKLLEEIKGIPYPLLVKAAAGGGGKGMRIVKNESELLEAIQATSREAKSYFGDGSVFVEKFVENPRHIEVQILADNFGNTVHLYERECSVQRRYQKIIEESPSVTLTPEVREKMCGAAVQIASKIGYNSAGTIEFLVDKDLNFYFLEMNTRIQVEHPVTELVTRTDIVAEQILIAAGNPLRLKQENISQKGHAIECRIYAENPFENFMPSPGQMTLYKPPKQDYFRLDSGICSETVISSNFDPMISKLIVWANNRDEAIHKMIYGLKEYKIQGIKTNISYLAELMKLDIYKNNEISTKICDIVTPQITKKIIETKEKIPLHIPLLSYLIYCFQKDYKLNNIWQKIGYWRNVSEIKVNLDGKLYKLQVDKFRNPDYEIIFQDKLYKVKFVSLLEHELSIIIDDSFIITNISNSEELTFLNYGIFDFELSREDYLIEQEFESDYSTNSHSNFVSAPMPGKVIKINVSEGKKISKGTVLLIVEAMKMENNIVAPKDVVIKKINAKVGDMIETSTKLILFEDEE